MKLQISTDYAVRILQYLHENSESLNTGSTIAEAVGVPYPFFIKIANQLKRQNLIYSIQGRTGGYFLMKPAEEISLYDVFRSIEGELILSHCFNGQRCSKQQAGKGCKFHGVLKDMQEMMISELARQSIADIA